MIMGTRPINPGGWLLGQYKGEFVPFMGGDLSFYCIPPCIFSLTHLPGQPGLPVGSVLHKIRTLVFSSICKRV